MAQFKIVVLAVMVIIGLNSCKAQNSNTGTNGNEIVFYNSHEKISIQNNRYVVINNANGFELKLLDNDTIEKLKKIENPVVKFCIENKEYTARGEDLLSSNVPSNADYFFPLYRENKIVFFKDYLISFKKISTPTNK
jgi:uncharacterized membrane protein